MQAIASRRDKTQKKSISLEMPEGEENCDELREMQKTDS